MDVFNSRICVATVNTKRKADTEPFYLPSMLSNVMEADKDNKKFKKKHKKVLDSQKQSLAFGSEQGSYIDTPEGRQAGNRLEHTGRM